MFAMIRRVVIVLATALTAFTLTSCASSPVTPTFADGFIKAVPTLSGTTSSTGVFGVISNPGSEDMKLVKATNTTVGLTNTPLEVHEMVMKNGAMVMQPVAGGINVPAKGSTTLKPGGLHVMYVNLMQPIPVGSKVTLTLEFSNGTTVPITVVARDLANAQENYTPGSTPAPSMSMSR